MRHLFRVVALSLLLVTPAAAAEPKCPLDVQTCLMEFGKMRERPWLGLEIESDSLGTRFIRGVVPGGPADRAGIHGGDVLERINGQDPKKWFAGKAGWKNAPPAHVTVQRDGHDVAIDVQPGHVPEEYLARMIGVHMIEGHLAYAGEEELHHR